MKKIGVVLFSLFACACSTHTTKTEPALLSKAQSPDPESQPAAPQVQLQGVEALDFYSSYMSDTAKESCSSELTECIEDPVPAQLWFDILEQSLTGVELGAGNNTTDYEILVASQLRKTQSDAPLQRALSSVYLAPDVESMESLHGEFTVQWRGFALDTYATSSSVNNSEDVQNQAVEMVMRWKNHASSVGVFTREFLYSSLRASNYRQQLVVPPQLGEFYLEDVQLYADPFRGAVSRYRHPMFENAILDITVSPILASLSTVNGNWMKQELSRELARAEQVAKDRSMALVVERPISVLTAVDTEGHFFSVKAEDEFDEPLYAATYLFRRKDKLVKFTSSFPYHVAEPLVLEALATMQVPDESALMEEVRAMF